LRLVTVLGPDQVQAFAIAGVSIVGEHSPPKPCMI
jgi:hypothetical protein